MHTFLYDSDLFFFRNPLDLFLQCRFIITSHA